MTTLSKTLLEWADRQNLSGRDQARKAAELLGITASYWRQLTRNENPPEPKRTLIVAIEQWNRADWLESENGKLRSTIETLTNIINSR